MDSILIVDDETIIRELLADVLGDKFECQTCQDAEAALVMLDGREFAAVVTDISLPGKSGLEFLGTMRQQKPEVPVIVVSGIHDAPYAQGLMEMGAFGYLSKPLDIRDIESMVTRAVEARRRGLTGQEQLRARRFELQIEARLSGVLIFDDQEEQGMVMVAGITRDLSQTGVGVIVPRESMDMNRVIGKSFQLVLGMIEGSMALDAMVVRVKVIDEERCLIGARFTNLSGRDRMQLLLYLNKHHRREQPEDLSEMDD